MIGCMDKKQEDSINDTNENELSSANTEDNSIEFYTVYNDFVVTTDDQIFYELIQKNNQIYTFTDDDSWYEFKSANFNELKLPDMFLSDKTLLCLPLFSAKPTLVVQFYIDRMELSGNILTVYVNTTGVEYSGTEEKLENTYNLIMATVDSDLLPEDVQIELKYVGDE
jgi:hypothetical protein